LASVGDITSVMRRYFQSNIRWRFGRDDLDQLLARIAKR
jgi:hypothetical protein